MRKLSSKPDYEAISYVWGDPESTETIYCNGLQLKITVNLAHGLRHIRYVSKARTLWADAICIDQNNAKERGHQVQLMANIYTNAREVRVWLGQDTAANAQLAVDGMTAYVKYIAKDFKIREWSNKYMLDAISQLLGRFWFHRAWGAARSWSSCFCHNAVW